MLSRKGLPQVKCSFPCLSFHINFHKVYNVDTVDSVKTVETVDTVEFVDIILTDGIVNTVIMTVWVIRNWKMKLRGCRGQRSFVELVWWWWMGWDGIIPLRLLRLLERLRC